MRGVVLSLRKKMPNPLKLLQADADVRAQFILEMTYHSNAIEEAA